ncbi:dynein light chain roadblock-type 1-like [Stomoxys calcitrans]|uniref:Roadblock/LAMTOR2 domain-containing protein n=1 Tax=Stomoxys calcitrans TaxID=35570 RepID=A0A1I8PU42_STOCA|nr:dynein light chain roadblock-type 1-like [Stomoxys calcitrans]
MASLDDIIKQNSENTQRIIRHAQGYVIANNTNGTIAATSYDNVISASINKLINGILVGAARSAVRDLDCTNDLAFLRVATQKCEYLVAPEEDFTIVVVQGK